MFVTTIIFAWNEERMLPYQLRNAQKYSDRIVLFDDGSTDSTVAIARAAGVDVFDYTHLSGGQLSNQALIDLKNSAYKTMPGDWFFIHDMDELPYFRFDMRKQLQKYTELGVTLPLVEGFNIAIDHEAEPVQPDDDLVIKHRFGFAAPQYCKRVVVHKSCNVNYKHGAHKCAPVNGVASTTAPIKLLHYPCAFGPEFRIERCRLQALRRSAQDRSMGWGSHYECASREQVSTYKQDLVNRQWIPL